MKKIVVFILMLSLMFALTGCFEKKKPVTDEPETITYGLPEDMPEEFFFSSGAGGWCTEIILKKDGSFTGNFHDSEMGVINETHPNGTYYVCNFSGRFENIEKINNYTYSLTLTELITEEEEGKEWIEDGVLYIASYPYGLDGGKNFVLYTPDCPVEGLPEDFLIWWPKRFEMEEKPSTLSYYGIHNLAEDYGIFSN